MNTHRPIESVRAHEPAVLNAAFNQDQTCFAVCHETGFQVYNTDPMELRMKRTFSTNGGVGLIAMLHRTNYVALVGGGRQPRFPVNKLCIWDDLKKKPSIMLEFMSPILNVLLSRILIVVVLKNKVLIHAFESKPKLLAQHETYDNEAGVAELSVNEQTSFLAFPGRAIGQIQLVDVSPAHRDRNLISIIKAHRSKIQCLAISNSGHLIASASQTGTIIRIHDTAKCSLRFELRRGLDRATITSIKFSPDDSKLAVLSDKNTLHVYNLTAADPQPESAMANRLHLLSAVPLMPTYFRSVWSFVSYHIDTKDDAVNDCGVLGWADNESIVVLWKKKGIWEKYVLVENDKWTLVREGWRRFEE
ncbi:SVP1-like protein 2 [Ogataea parapolymorpha DL-1]|uniref:SVP1-like protein 2 n=1 Tax=Ogataea parapolymorpha (strain ATCC 26012 / BCRC 20466 / JCM 22074 / NRRL Y-7560 / DL-1) TaxID=871575 RepID=W1QKF5_OGAPD|nr:SVP1-like protein 2 [Ogataea parapolymorpha DL-1]ESX03633.1 SVP1-like protein 2 [Ogataea parapolymorpha DL-1]